MPLERDFSSDPHTRKPVVSGSAVHFPAELIDWMARQRIDPANTLSNKDLAALLDASGLYPHISDETVREATQKTMKGLIESSGPVVVYGRWGPKDTDRLEAQRKEFSDLADTIRDEWRKESVSATVEHAAKKIGSSTVEEELFPDRSERVRRITALLSSVNNGPKTVLLGSILPTAVDTYADTTAISTKLVALMEETDFLGLHSTSVLSYLDTLVQLGVATRVTEETEHGHRIRGYGLTTAGIQFGRRAASLAMHYEMLHDESTADLGQVQSPTGHTSPYHRAVILKEIDELGPHTSITDLMRTTQLSRHNVSEAIVQLKRLGHVDAVSVTPQSGEQLVNFGLGDKSFREFDSLREIEHAVASCCETLLFTESPTPFPVTQKSIFDILPESIKQRHTEASLRIRITSILSDLADKGFLTRGKFEGKVVYSDISLLPKGKAFVDDFISPLILLAEEDPATIQRIDTEIIPEIQQYAKDYVLHSLQLYYPYSRVAERRDHDAKIYFIGELIRSISDDESLPGLSQMRLSQVTGISLATIPSYMEELEDQLIIDGFHLQKTIVNQLRYYKIISDISPPEIIHDIVRSIPSRPEYTGIFSDRHFCATLQDLIDSTDDLDWSTILDQLRTDTSLPKPIRRQLTSMYPVQLMAERIAAAEALSIEPRAFSYQRSLVHVPGFQKDLIRAMSNSSTWTEVYEAMQQSKYISRIHSKERLRWFAYAAKKAGYLIPSSLKERGLIKPPPVSMDAQRVTILMTDPRYSPSFDADIDEFLAPVEMFYRDHNVELPQFSGREFLNARKIVERDRDRRQVIQLLKAHKLTDIPYLYDAYQALIKILGFEEDEDKDRKTLAILEELPTYIPSSF